MACSKISATRQVPPSRRSSARCTTVACSSLRTRGPSPRCGRPGRHRDRREGAGQRPRPPAPAARRRCGCAAARRCAARFPGGRGSPAGGRLPSSSPRRRCTPREWLRQAPPAARSPRERTPAAPVRAGPTDRAAPRRHRGARWRWSRRTRAPAMAGFRPGRGCGGLARPRDSTPLAGPPGPVEARHGPGRRDRPARRRGVRRPLSRPRRARTPGDAGRPGKRRSEPVPPPGGCPHLRRRRSAAPLRRRPPPT